MGTQMVVFKLGNEGYAVKIDVIEGIIKLQTITYLPHAPEFVVGITNLRGNIVPVIDLKKRLHLPQSEPTIDTRIIVALLQESKVGMIVDAVSQVIDIAETEIEPTPPMSSSIDTEFINGIVKIDNNLVILLDLEKVLSTNE